MISYEELSQVFDMDNPLTLEYFELCNVSSEIGEVHHILPRSLFNELINVKKNKVRLSYQHHLKAHKILPSICLLDENKTKMIRALWLMTHTRSGEAISPEEYEVLKAEFSRNMHGENSPNYGRVVPDSMKEHLSKMNIGKKHSDEVRSNMRAAQQNRPEPTEETRKKIADSKRGIKRSPETIEKMRNSSLGKRHTDDTKALISQAGKGRKHKQSSIEKMRQSKKGVNFSESHRQALSESHKGYKYSESQLAKLSEALTKFYYLQIDNQGNILRKWAPSELRGAGFDASAVSAVCNGKQNRKTYKGFGWSKVPKNNYTFTVTLDNPNNP